MSESHDSLNTGNNEVTPSLSLATDSYNQQSKIDRDTKVIVQQESPQSSYLDNAKANPNQEIMGS